MGLAKYYSQYVKDYAKLAGPLMDMLKVTKDEGRKGSTVPLTWTPKLILSFEVLKKALTVELELFQVEPDQPFRIRTDACDYAIGAVLEQERGGEWVPVCFYSRKLTGSQKNWTAREKEAYAIIASLWKWAGWIGCSPVEVVTHHKSLEDWVKEHVETKSGLTGRRARWHEIFSQFDLTKVYKPGKDNVVADAMSRWAYPASTAKGDVSIHGTAESAQEVKDMEEEQTQWRKADVGRRKHE